MPRCRRLALLTLSLCSAPFAGALASQDEPYRPAILGPSKEGELALRKFVHPDDLEVSLWAAEPKLANPVAFWIDGHGRVYVVETFRLHKGVTDNRKYGRAWVDQELACRTVEDRIALYRREFADKLPSLTSEHERVRLLWDADDDGVADHDEVFADGFHQLEDGIAAGVLEHHGDVFFTCIPKLWRLRDTDGDGRADQRTVLHDGFGVHTALLGHDMHGLVVGPDGRLYFSIGDRGLSVPTAGGRIEVPDEGAVLRCELDGSGLEVFHRGLRNPQELAFDDFGNLFTGDNNSDGGDRARFVYLLPGGDCGWRIGYQTLGDRGPWNREKLWHPPFRGQAAYINPPVDNYAAGPSGLCFDPGTGLPPRWRRHFLLCDFRGSSANSGVFALRLEAKGAGFELCSEGPVVRSVLATDVDVGPDGAIWISDWTEGWDQPMKGRIYRLQRPENARDPLVAQTRQLLASDLRKVSTAELLDLLGHPDRRVRHEAQLVLATGDDAVRTALRDLALRPAAPRMARIHAIWALGQVARRGQAAVLDPLLPLAEDADHEIRGQWARVCGDAHNEQALRPLIGRLRDRSARVRSLAALALGEIGNADSLPPLLRMLADNDDRDPWLRHAGVVGLVGVRDAAALAAHADDESPAVRLALCVALRRLASPEVARFLDDALPAVALEAARAVYDQPIAEALPALAQRLEGAGARDPEFLRRAIAACHRIGDAASADRLAAFAVCTDAVLEMREQALAALAEWAHPGGRDRILDLWRPIADRGPDLARAALAPHAARLLRDAQDGVARAAARAAGALGLAEVAPDLEALARDSARSGGARAAALAALEKVSASSAASAASVLAASDDPTLRKAATRVVSRLDPAMSVKVLDALVASAPVDEQQNALLALGTCKATEADSALLRWLEVSTAGELAPELRLDLLEAAAKRDDPRIKARLTALDAGRAADDPLAPWREALVGGDAKKGEHLFWNHEAAVCTRCHALGDSGGNVGPPLDHVGARLGREQILESLVLPQARIADGYGTVVVTRRSGEPVAGVLRRDDGKVLCIQTPDGDQVEVAVDDVTSRSPPASAMPPMAAILGKRELRDVVEFLATRK
ncbi:MAG: HEAT repeat domain-containing protein [Planctomycetota bacterium]